VDSVPIRGLPKFVGILFFPRPRHPCGRKLPVSREDSQPFRIGLSPVAVGWLLGAGRGPGRDSDAPPRLRAELVDDAGRGPLLVVEIGLLPVRRPHARLLPKRRVGRGSRPRHVEAGGRDVRGSIPQNITQRRRDRGGSALCVPSSANSAPLREPQHVVQVLLDPQTKHVAMVPRKAAGVIHYPSHASMPASGTTYTPVASG
jgi:hypothetical protein